jgi:hypothetical protein
MNRQLRGCGQDTCEGNFFPFLSIAYSAEKSRPRSATGGTE